MSSKKEKKNETGCEEGYNSEIDYYHIIAPSAEERADEIETELAMAFKDWTKPYESRQIDLSTITSEQLSELLLRHPKLLKPLSVMAVVAGRAFEKDLGIKNINTYEPNLDKKEAFKIAGYLLSQMPRQVLLESLRELDRNQFIDKEKRKFKGSWENLIREMLINLTGLDFAKCKIRVSGEEYEIDAAYFEGKYLKYAIDVKKIGARRDFQKRSDEIVNKSDAYKRLYPDGNFAAVVHYPFEKDAVRSRLKRDSIDLVVFANDSPESIAEAVKDLIRGLQIQSASRQSHIS